MDPDRWSEIRGAFALLREVGPEGRAVALRGACGHDPWLLAEVSSLLEEHDAADAEGFLDDALDDSQGGPDEPPCCSLETGARVGPYVVERILGRGGMGSVYLARRVRDYDQDVALKLIHAPMNPSALRRFHAERQLLAQLAHPRIVRLLDGGATDEGAPYLVTELIDGLPLDKHCERAGATIPQRARLVLQVAGAIAYAHDQGVVHRDLKPSNVLVGADGVPKVTDFGLARSVPRPGASQSGMGLLAGTPGYMAPEQITGEGRNLPAVDVYGLGAILFKLLVGRPPFAAETAMETWLLTTTTEAPSPRRLNPSVPRDLDTIVRKGLARDPSERFASADELADQLRLYLEGRPLTIRPPGAWTRLGKWVARHRAGVASWVASILAIQAVMVAILATQVVRARRSEAI